MLFLLFYILFLVSAFVMGSKHYHRTSHMVRAPSTSSPAVSAPALSLPSASPAPSCSGSSFLTPMGIERFRNLKLWEEDREIRRALKTAPRPIPTAAFEAPPPLAAVKEEPVDQGQGLVHDVTPERESDDEDYLHYTDESDFNDEPHDLDEDEEWD